MRKLIAHPAGGCRPWRRMAMGLIWAVAATAVVPLTATRAAAAAGSLNVVLGSRSIPADGTAKTTARATVLDGTGAAVANQVVRFATDGNVTFNPPAGLTGGDGSLTTTITASSTAGAETITGSTVAGGVAASGSAVLYVGAGWSAAKLSTIPPGRRGAAMAYDAATSTAVLFGGAGNADSGVVPPFGVPFLGDTWTWDGARWTPQAPPLSPGPRWGASMAYDAATGTAVLFGGVVPAPNPIPNGSLVGALTVAEAGDTWTWDGRTWTRQAPAASPQPRHDAGMAYDPTTGKVVLFGGRADNTADGTDWLGDTWTWDGTSRTWTQETPPTPLPVGRQSPSLTPDPTTGSLLLFGGGILNPGLSSEPFPLGDTWLWSGRAHTWTQVSPAASPSPRFAAVMATVDATRSVMLFGGDDGNGTEPSDTWTWNGATWVRQTLLPSPGGFISDFGGAAWAYDPANRTVVMLEAGSAQNGSNTWTYLDASATNLSLSQPVIPANGVATTTATAVITGVDGTPSTPTSGEAVALHTSPGGGVTLGPVSSSPASGTYVTTITASNTPEVETITAVPALGTVSASAQLVETGAGAALNPSALNFGGQPVGAPATTRNVTLTNTSTFPLAISGISTAGIGFSQTNGCPSTLATAAGCTITVSFTPTTAGTRTGALSVTDNATGSPQTVSLTGTGLPALTGDASAIYLQGVTLLPATAPHPLPDGGQGVCEAGPVRTATAATAAGGGLPGCQGSTAGNLLPLLAANVSTEAVTAGAGTARAHSNVASLALLPGMGLAGADVLDVSGLDAQASASCSGNGSGTPAASSSIAGTVLVNGTRVATQPVGSRIIFNPTGKNPITLYGNPITVNPAGSRVPMAIVTLNYSRYDPGTNTQVSSPLEVEFPPGGALSSVIVGRVFVSYTRAGCG